MNTQTLAKIQSINIWICWIIGISGLTVFFQSISKNQHNYLLLIFTVYLAWLSVPFYTSKAIAKKSSRNFLVVMLLANIVLVLTTFLAIYNAVYFLNNNLIFLGVLLFVYVPTFPSIVALYSILQDMKSQNIQNDLGIADWYNNSAIEIWREHGHNQPHVPLMIPEINTDIDILFVGMNPSHRVEWIEKQLQANAERFNNYSAEDLFAWREESLQTRVPYIQLMEQHARENDNQYFGALTRVVIECGLKTWTHLDLFLVRETNQNTLLQQIEYDESRNYINQFGKKQVELFTQTLNKIKPKCIVVNNATTSVFLSKLLVDENETKTMISYQDTPVFFGGMLSGARSMDRFARLRLINEIKQTIKVPQLSQINEIKQTIKVPQLSQNLMSINELYSRLKQKITDLDKNIYFNELTNYYGFKCESIRGRKVSFADVYVKAKKIQIQISNTNYDDPKNLVEISRNQKWTLNKHIVLTSHADIQYVIEIIRQSYKFVKGSVNE